MRIVNPKAAEFEAKFDRMVRSAREFSRNRRYRSVKTVPNHIQPKYDEQLQGWGMFNTRLNIWVDSQYDDYVMDYIHPVFGTPEDVIVWYKTLI